MDDIDKILAILKENGAQLERTKKHKVYRFPDGRIWVIPSTPRSSQSYRNNYHDLCNFIGVQNTQRKNPDRKGKRGIERKPKAVASGVKMKEPFEGLNAVRKYCSPAICEGAMWIQRVQVNPLVAVLRSILRRGNV